jgi:hypothetical protein
MEYWRSAEYEGALLGPGGRVCPHGQWVVGWGDDCAFAWGFVFEEAEPGDC